MTRAERGPQVPATPVALIHRLEGGAIAAAVVTFFILSGFAWWWLLVFFLLFDVSAIGYAVSNKAGAIGYNAVHNYVAPALVAAIYGIQDSEAGRSAGHTLSSGAANPHHH